MKTKTKHITILMLLIFLSTIVEKIIPHEHVEKDGVVNADFFHDEKEDHEESEHEADTENLHSSNYQPSNFVFVCQPNIVKISFIQNHEKIVSVEHSKKQDYNILPKILSSLLSSIQKYSSKAPPLFA